MAKIEKKTQIKGLPPKVLLTTKDSVTGSYPLVLHNIEFKRNIGWKPFFDQKTINFISSSTIYFGLNVPTGSNYVPEISFMTSSLTGSNGRVVAGISDTFFYNQRYGTISSSFEPFRDSEHPSLDGTTRQDPFWTSGSNYAGLTAPVWSKDKIEIDFTPLTASSMTGSRPISNIRTTSYMAYYNFAERRWNQLVPTGPFTPGTRLTSTNYFGQLKGFSSSHNVRWGSNFWNSSSQITIEKRYLNRGRPISTFGFPFNDIFEATSSMLLPMSNYINRPFLVEKVFVMMSASFRLSTLPGTLENTLDYYGQPFYTTPGIIVSSSYVVNNFFILNQRKARIPYELEFTTYRSDDSVLNPILLNYSSSKTTRDLITWFEIASFNKDYNHHESASAYPEYYYRDVTIFVDNTTSTTSSWSQMLIMSGAAKSPKSSVVTHLLYGNNSIVETAIYEDPIKQLYYNVGWQGTRNGLPPTNASGRDLVNAYAKYSGEILTTGSLIYANMQIGSKEDDWSRPNPYLLLPTDNLIFGWQLPTHDDISGALNSSPNAHPTGSFIEFPVAPAKVIFYGSYLTNNVGYNDTLSQELTSNSVHEAIE